MRQHPAPSGSSRCRRALAALACAAAGGALAQPLAWGIVEQAARGCVDEASVQFDAVGALGGHAPQPLCGATAVRMYPEPLPTGLLTISFRNQRGEPRRYQVPLDAVLAREQLRMQQSLLQVVYGQDSVELWIRPLAPAADGSAPAAGTDAPATPRRIYSRGLELDATVPPPGISRSR